MLKYPSNRSCTSGWRRCLVLLALGSTSAASAEQPHAADPRVGAEAVAPAATAPVPAAVPPTATVQAAPATIQAAPVDAELAAFNDPPPGGSVDPADGTQPVLPGAPRLHGRRDPFMRLRVDGHVALTWSGAFGVGMRADFPLISGTFRYSNRDELAISAGGDVTFVSFNGSHVVEVFPTATLQWSLSVNERGYFFPELGIVGHVDGGRWDGLHPNFGFGARYYLRRSFSLQGRLGWPIAFAGGVTF